MVTVKVDELRGDALRFVSDGIAPLLTEIFESDGDHDGLREFVSRTYGPTVQIPAELVEGK